MLSLVKTKINNWISSGTLKSSINTAKSKLTSAYYPYIENMWVANLSTTVSGWHVSTYNSRMTSVNSNLASEPNEIVRVGKTPGPVLSRLWTKVHETLGQRRRPFVLCSALVRLSTPI